MMMTRYGSRSAGIGASVVEAGQVPRGGPGEAAVAGLHLGDGPVEGGLGALRLRDDRHHQVRQAVVGGQLDALEVDEDQPDLVGRGVAQQARDQRVDHDALARPGGPGDEQVRHLGEVGGAGVAGDVAAERESQLGGAAQVHFLENPAQRDDVEVLVGDLDAHDALARDRRLDPDRPSGQRHGEVVREGLDAADLDLGRGLDLVLSHDRAGVPGDDPGREC